MEDNDAPLNKCQKKVPSDCGRSSEEKNRDIPVLHGYRIQILDAGIGKVRSKLFRDKVTELGGTLCSSISDHPQILVVDENMTADRLCRLLKIEGPRQLESLMPVRSLWLSDCIKNKKLLPTESYKLHLNTSRRAISPAETNPSTSQQPRSQQAAVQRTTHCPDISVFYHSEDSDVDSASNDVASGEEDEAKGGGLCVNSEATVPQQRPLPVCFLCNN